MPALVGEVKGINRAPEVQALEYHTLILFFLMEQLRNFWLLKSPVKGSTRVPLEFLQGY